MSVSRRWRVVVTFLGLTLVLMSNSARAAPMYQEAGGADRAMVLASTVAGAISYQGRLTNAAGAPLNGVYNLVFQIWDHDTAGNRVGADIVKSDVAVNAGLFSVSLEIPSGAMSSVDGRGLWLRVQVNGQWLAPRQELLPAPYALTLRPGAFVSSPGPDTLHVWNSAGGYAIEAWSHNNAAVQGKSDTHHGVVGWTGTEEHGEISGVFGHSTEGTGVTGRSVNYNGMKAITQSNEHAALAAGNEGGGPAIYAQGGTQGVAAVFRGNVRIQSRDTGATIVELGQGLDYAEGFDVTDAAGVEPGAVLVIDAEHVGRLTLSRVAYDRKVAGIVAGAAGLGSGVRLGGNEFEYDVALAGRVYCNVDATYGIVEPGDLLTTSPTAGYAMKALDHDKAQGAILGKAMQGLAAGEKGQILVLVSLQ